MHILVVNSGSSSIKFSFFKTDASDPDADPACLLDGELAGVGHSDASIKVNGPAGEHSKDVDADSPAKAIHAVANALESADLPPADAVGYRVVHPGPTLRGHQRVTPQVLDALERATTFAPLHDPAAVEMIRAMIDRAPETPRFVCFDTVFHETMPEEASIYAIPKHFREQGVRRYGFHGLSLESVVRRVRLETGAFPKRAVIAHLGSGCSVTALLDGQSVDTSMGLTPTGGVVMGTRPGDLDPGLILYLLRQQPEGTAEAIEKLLNRDSGMVALSDLKNDVRAVRQAAANGDRNAQLALDVFTRSVRKTIGAYAFLLGGLDALFFAGGIGEHDPLTRAEILHGLDEFGISLDIEANRHPGKGFQRFDDAHSRATVAIVPAEEDLMIALHVARMAKQDSPNQAEPQPESHEVTQ
jgi:acetate kinase